MGTKTIRALLAAGVLFTGTAVFGMQHPNQSRGFTGPMIGTGIDAISPYNGGLTVTIPLGEGYPVNTGFGYMLKLVYNGNLWNYEQIGPYIEAEPQRNVTAGFGWVVTMGQIFAPNNPPWNASDKWVYLTPDGGGHSFWNTMHEDEGDGDANPGDTTYTRDGSYLRMKKLGSNWRHIEFPDGSVHQFGKTGGTWTLRRIDDAYGNWVTISYSTSGSDSTWTIADRKGRTHYVRLSSMAWFGQTVQEVDLETVGGARNVYYFDYETIPVNRSCKDDYDNNDRILVPHLTRVTLPDGTFYSMTDSSGDPNYHNICTGNIDDLPGVLKGVQLPTGGKIEWQHQKYTFPGPANEEEFNSSAGVSTRILKNADDTEIGRWTYKTTKVNATGGNDAEVRTDIVQPTGDCTRYYFAGRYSLENAPVNRGWEYGMPFVWRESSGGRYLSSEVYDSSNGTSCATQSGQKLRSTYLLFEHDKLPSSEDPADKPEWYASNRRVMARRTVFNDDGDKYVDTENSDFDGVGHYRQTETSGNFSGVVQTRTSETDFNAGRNTYAYHQDENWPINGGSNYVPVAVAETWNFRKFTYQEVEDLGANGMTAARTEVQLNGQGSVTGKRVLANGATLSANDILTLSTIDAGTGNVTQQRIFGGDTQALSTSGGPTTFSAPVPATGGFQTNYTYQNGVLATAQPVVAGGAPMPWYSYDVDTDPRTGKVLTSRSPAGITTTYVYDDFGRLASIQPQDGAQTNYSYTLYTPGVAPKVGTSQTVGLTYLRQSEIEFDGLGRAVKNRVLTPDHGWTERETTYNARSWPLTSTVMGLASKKIAYLEYDAFGRAARVRPPDGAAHDVTFDFYGSRRVVSHRSAATAPGVETQVSREAYYDSFGRMEKVIENSGAGGTSIATTYDYDVLGNMTEISTTDKATSVTQARLYTFDGRGLTLAERHPEKGTSGNGWVNYSQHNALGKAGHVSDGDNDLDFVYDPIGRLVRTEDANASNRALLEYTYDGAPGAGTSKAWTATRHNYLDLPWTGPGEDTVSVTEAYRYEGLNGAMSERLTTIDPMAYAFRQSQTYDDLGNVATMTYPDCEHAACPVGEPARTIQNVYSEGALTGVTGWADAITYHVNGMWNQVDHSNLVDDVQNRDASGIPRPKRIKAVDANGTNLFDTFVYSYDGSGNIKGTSTETYVYDSVGRLTYATVKGDTQDFSYDPFGNITEVTTTFPDLTYETITSTIDMNTNRVFGATYEASGAMTSWNGNGYTYDALNRLIRHDILGSTRHFVYTAGGERIWTIAELGSAYKESFTLRGGAKVLRTFEVTGRESGPETWEWEQDYIYRGGVPLASALPNGEERHYHADHLGNIRAITDENGVKLSTHHYYPYGLEWSDPSASNERMRFTGHERDNGDGGTAYVTDYMHARYFSPLGGRFNRVDPRRGSPGSPQSLNRYTYALGNPLKYMDPDGRQALNTIIVEPAGGMSKFGHSMLMIETGTNSYGISLGGDWGFGASHNNLSAAINGYLDQGRSVSMWVSLVTPSQAQAAYDFASSTYPNHGTNGGRLGPYNNCTTAVTNAMDAAGVDGGDDGVGEILGVDVPSALEGDLNDGNPENGGEIQIDGSIEVIGEKDPFVPDLEGEAKAYDTWNQLLMGSAMINPSLYYIRGGGGNSYDVGSFWYY